MSSLIVVKNAAAATFGDGFAYIMPRGCPVGWCWLLWMWECNTFVNLFRKQGPANPNSVSSRFQGDGHGDGGGFVRAFD